MSWNIIGGIFTFACMGGSLYFQFRRGLLRPKIKEAENDVAIGANSPAMSPLDALRAQFANATAWAWICLGLSFLPFLLAILLK